MNQYKRKALLAALCAFVLGGCKGAHPKIDLLRDGSGQNPPAVSSTRFGIASVSGVANDGTHKIHFTMGGMNGDGQTDGTKNLRPHAPGVLNAQ